MQITTFLRCGMMILFASAWCVAADDGPAGDLQQGITDLKTARDDSTRLATAAASFLKAQDNAVEAGDTETAQQASAYLYWCLQSMNEAEADALQVSTPPLTADQAAQRLTAADAFAQAHPAEQLLTAARYWEIFQRGRGTPSADAAFDKSIKAATDIIRSLFTLEYAKRDPATQSNLAKLFVASSSKREYGPAIRYAMLLEANRLGVMAGDLATSLDALDKLNQSFDIDFLAYLEKTLNDASRILRDDEHLPALYAGYKRLAELAIQQGELRQPYQYLRNLKSYARRIKDDKQDARQAEIDVLDQKLAYIQKEFPGVQNAHAKLAQSPDDAMSNLIMGKYLVFYIKDYTRGFPLLAKGSDKELARAASMELAEDKSPGQTISLADLYYQIGQSERRGAVRVGILGRAAHHYQEVLPGLQGLEQVKVLGRIQEAGEEAAATALASIEGQIAPGNVALAKNGATAAGLTRSEEAIDGSRKCIDIRGFATGNTPCELTIVLDKTYNLQLISFLLFDRFEILFRYRVDISPDGKVWTELVDRSEGDWRGWQHIKVGKLPVKAIRIHGLYSSNQDQFRVVELEAYCEPPAELP